MGTAEIYRRKQAQDKPTTKAQTDTSVQKIQDAVSCAFIPRRAVVSKRVQVAFFKKAWGGLHFCVLEAGTAVPEKPSALDNQRSVPNLSFCGHYNSLSLKTIVCFEAGRKHSKIWRPESEYCTTDNRNTNLPGKPAGRSLPHSYCQRFRSSDLRTDTCSCTRTCALSKRRGTAQSRGVWVGIMHAAVVTQASLSCVGACMDPSQVLGNIWYIHAVCFFD